MDNQFHQDCQSAMRVDILAHHNVKTIALNNSKGDFALVLSKVAEHALFNFILDGKLYEKKEIADWLKKLCANDGAELSKYTKAVCGEVYGELQSAA